VILDTGIHFRVQSVLREGSEKSGLSSGHISLPRITSTQSKPEPLGNFANLAQATVHELIGASFEALDLLNIGLILCGESGQLQFTNRTADNILQSRDGLEIDAYGLLRATKPCVPSLAELIERVLRSESGNRAGSADAAISLRRPSKRALTVLVRRANGVTPNGGNTNKPGVLLIVIDSALPVHTKESELRRLYSLTLTESRLAKLLMEGKDLDGCCEELGISRSTVRMHRRNLFSKAGVRRQTQLITLLFKSIGLGPRS
jgi:DNA-binding CsgD family transcriptional regulator